MNIKAKNFITVFMALIVVIISVFPACAQKMSAEIKSPDNAVAYSEYTEQNSGNSSANNSIVLLAENISETKGNVQIRNDYNGKKAIYTDENSVITWNSAVPAGKYSMRVTYYPEDGRASYAQRQILINGTAPFEEAKSIYFYSIYKDENGISQDYYGNDIRSTQVKSPRWFTVDVYDHNQYENLPLEFSFDGSMSSVSFVAEKEPMTIYSVELIPVKEIKTYEKTKEDYDTKGYKKVSDAKITCEAENCEYKSDPTIVPKSDNSSSTSPHDNYLVKLNKISGENWVSSGQFISWKIHVDKAGLYQISLKTKQNYNKGLYSSRRLYVNGEVPFAEANNIKFTYTKDWENSVLGDSEPWLFYLNEGNNEIRLETILGDMGPVLNKVGDILEQLNQIYREILVVTGSTPDTYRDYRLDELLPDTMNNIKVQSDRLSEVFESIYKITGQKGSDFSIFDTLIKQLNSFTADPDKIPVGFSYFKTNIGSLGTWLTAAMKQPLDMDYLVVYSPEQKLDNANAGIFKSFADSVASFLASFTVDYNKIGNLSENDSDPITVWVTSGRDQMQTLKVMVQNTFVKESGINVQLENVSADSILKAVVAGNGPDIILGAGGADPVNYALRNAAYNLNQFDDISEVCKRFYPESLVPFKLNGGLYALPEKISCQLMFYRTDILKEMGLGIPETWNDVIEIVSTLQKNNMTFGLPAAAIEGTYCTFMYQYGGSLYSEDGKTCLLSSEKNSTAFEKLVNFYSNYSLELQYDFANRFRTGEIPIAIDSIDAYNNLKVSAPEIEGLWGVALLPGVEQADGSINRSGYLNATASMIFANSKQPDKAYEFLKWWTSADTQSKFGTELESILGPSARYFTANREAFNNLPWTDEELDVLQTQLNFSKAVPEVPGGYYISRHLNNAFRSVVVKKEDIKDTLDKYTKAINDELETKRKEFGM